MCNPLINLSQLNKGDKGIVCCLGQSEISLKLMEMGCLPGSEVTVEGVAPMGDPIKINIDNEYSLSLRKSEAKSIMLR